MSEAESLKAAEKLKQYFSSRVLNQVRQVIDMWRQLPAANWSAASVAAFTQDVEKLLKFAQRFEADKHQKLAAELIATLVTLKPGHVPDSAQLELLNTLVIDLSKTALRHSDSQSNGVPIPEKKPVYLALSQSDHAELMADQMQYFRLRPEALESPEEFRQALERRHPAVLVMDMDFGGPEQGIQLVQQLQASRESALPVIFTYRGSDRPSLQQQLAMMRCGGGGLYSDGDVHAVIGELEKLLDASPEAPYKILVVDDSRAQSQHAANCLNKAGILTEVINDPLQVLDVLNRFVPDLVLMDMYMPHCNGMELAKVIRQQREHINLPIIFLSGEEDRERQLAAMSEGGDDFLTKPVEANHLLAAVRNRITRARQLQNLIARDSLTGLLNHTHLLGALQDAMRRHPDTPITFAMVDIDHFKLVNDTHGHPAGDRVIRNLSLFLRQRLRKSDPIGRYGGEEFAVVLIDAGEEQAIRVMNDIRSGFANLLHDSKGLKATFSCGVAQWRGESLSELVSIADQALYRAKHQGRNQVVGASVLN